MMNERKKLLIVHLVFVLIFVLSSGPGMLCSQDNYKVLTGEKTNNRWSVYSDAPNSVYHYLVKDATKMLSDRRNYINGIQSLEEWKIRQAQVKEKLQKLLGSYPDKTPLNARVLGTVGKDFYKVEKIIYESYPGYYVTSALFLPKEINQKLPAVIYASGHQEWFNVEEYQEYILNLVKKGFIVFAYDPVGQNERVQFYNPDTEKSDVGISTTQHSYMGAQAAIIGRSQAQYMFWDGIRAIDYVVSRSEVDADRIGMVGTSGGGLQTAFIAAIDDRIYAAAPTNYITSLKRLLETIGPQDAEQNLIGGIAAGIDHGDYLEVRAPKPTLMLSSTRDFFSIQGARETINEVTRIYEAYGNPDHFTHVQEDTQHKFSQYKMEVTYAFFQKHLRNPGNPKTEKVSVLSPEEIQVTPTGQVATSFPQSKSESDLIHLDTRTIYSQLEESRKNIDLQRERVVQAAKRLSGYSPAKPTSIIVFTGNFSYDGYRISKYFIEEDDRYPIPFLMVQSESNVSKKRAIIYLNPEGKEDAMDQYKDELLTLVGKGYTVLIPDVSGIGELKPTSGDIHSLLTEWDAASLMGKSIVGLQARDINNISNILKIKFGMEKVYSVAFGNLCPALLHAAVFNGDITNIVLVNPVVSYREIAMSPRYDPEMVPGVVPGALPHYDLPDLMACYAPRQLTIIGQTDAMGKPLSSSDLRKEMAFVRDYYHKTSSDDRLKINADGEGKSSYLDVWGLE